MKTRLWTWSYISYYFGLVQIIFRVGYKWLIAQNVSAPLGVADAALLGRSTIVDTEVQEDTAKQTVAAADAANRRRSFGAQRECGMVDLEHAYHFSGFRRTQGPSRR